MNTTDFQLTFAGLAVCLKNAEDISLQTKYLIILWS
jgi:hypothetical protein